MIVLHKRLTRSRMRPLLGLGVVIALLWCQTPGLDFHGASGMHASGVTAGHHVMEREAAQDVDDGCLSYAVLRTPLDRHSPAAAVPVAAAWIGQLISLSVQLPGPFAPGGVPPRPKNRAGLFRQSVSLLI